MSSEFDQYFQEFLADDSNKFDIFKDDFINEPEGLHHSEDWQLEDRALSNLDPTPSPTFNAANSALGGEMSLPEIVGLAFFFFRSTLTGRAVYD
jgi:hypothetical protein